MYGPTVSLEFTYGGLNAGFDISEGTYVKSLLGFYFYAGVSVNLFTSPDGGFGIGVGTMAVNFARFGLIAVPSGLCFGPSFGFYIDTGIIGGYIDDLDTGGN